MGIIALRAAQEKGYFDATYTVASKSKGFSGVTGMGMGLWIESHQELRNHPKVKRLARLLGISSVTAIGHLHLFWWWAMDYAENGVLSIYEPADIADAAHWEGDAVMFLDAMVNCGPGNTSGFIERQGEALFVHDWYQYIGKLLEKKEKDRMRKSQKSACSGQRISDGFPTEIAGSPRLPNPPYLTQPDRTYQPNQPEAEEEAVTLAEVIALWNEQLVPSGFPEVQKPTPKRDTEFRARLNDDSNRRKLSWWQEQFEYMAQSQFLIGNLEKEASWLTFDWVLIENNLVKIAERKYKNSHWQPMKRTPSTQKNAPLNEYMAGFDSENPFGFEKPIGGENNDTGK